LYGRPAVAEALAFRGGTALHKLHLAAPRRYSEDVDLVQVESGPIGPVLGEVRAALDWWLGEPAWRQTADSVKLLYRFDTTSLPAQRMRVKIEINTREHFSVHGLWRRPYSVATLWHEASVNVTTYNLEELLATKLRALYQRKKGRDLYDLAAAVEALDVDCAGVVECFQRYMAAGGATVTRAVFEANLAEKSASPAFRGDVRPLLRDGDAYDVDAAFKGVQEQLIARLPGEPWKGHGPR
jgi:predicted nucleotidyltransferase component of viral defense system